MRIIVEKNNGLGEVSFLADHYLDSENLRYFYSVINELENDESIDFIILKGSDGIFCKGINIEEAINFNEAESKIFSFLGQRLIRRMRDIKKIVISLVDGEAFGGGFEFVLASDLVFATKNSKFGFPETNYGIIPGFGGSQLMSRKIYETFVKYLVFTGSNVDALELKNKGFIIEVFDSFAEMKKFLDDFIGKLRQRSIFAMGLAKEVINNGLEVDIDKALLIEQNAFTVAFASNDKKEGMSAFIEKRKPKFRDRWEKIKEF